MTSTISVHETAGRRHVVFRVAGESYGVELAAAREILPYRRPTRLPGAPAHVSGLINVRGTVVTVVDAGLWLGGVGCARDGAWVILLEGTTRIVGLAVDDVVDVCAFGDADPAQDGSTPVRGDPMRSAGWLGDRAVALLDARALLRDLMA